METVEKTNTSCVVKDSYVCQFLGCDGCGKCSINSREIRDYQRQEIADVWNVALSNMPSDANGIYESEECQFCMDGAPRKADGYAMVDLAHKEPETEKGFFMGLGTKMKVPIGSLIKAPVKVCPRCRENLKMRDKIKWISIVISALVGLAVLLVLSLTKALGDNLAMLPLLIFILIVGAGYFIGKSMSDSYVEKHRGETAYNFFKSEAGRKFAERGWFGFKDDQGYTKVMFSKKMPREHFNIIPEGYVNLTRPEDD